MQTFHGVILFGCGRFLNMRGIEENETGEIEEHVIENLVRWFSEDVGPIERLDISGDYTPSQLSRVLGSIKMCERDDIEINTGDMVITPEIADVFISFFRGLNTQRLTTDLTQFNTIHKDAFEKYNAFLEQSENVKHTCIDIYNEDIFDPECETEPDAIVSAINRLERYLTNTHITSIDVTNLCTHAYDSEDSELLEAFMAMVSQLRKVKTIECYNRVQKKNVCSCLS